MDADGLPIVGPGIDLTRVGAIHQKRTLAFLNHFITHTARFLNRFSCVCEERLEEMSIRLQRLETTMSILETKLSSIPGLENITVSSTSSQTQGDGMSATTATSTQPSAAQPVTVQSHTTKESEMPSAENVPAAAAAAEKPKCTVSQDPRYMKYFKMLQVGVPVPGIKMKMTADGLDPDLLDNPDAAAPGGGPQDDSDSDFSDEPAAHESDSSDISFSD